MDLLTVTLLLLTLFIQENSSLEEDKCANYAKDIQYHHPTVSYTPPKPSGVWVSSRCEIVPNPRYIMRRLDIQKSKWTSFIYHYSDSWCTKPTFKVKVTGTYEMLAATATPNSKTSYGAMFHFTNIYFNSDNAKSLENIITFILEKCPGALPSISTMQRDDVITLERYVNKFISLDVNAVLRKKHCRYFFVLHPGTYQKVRMTGEKSGTADNESHDTLYFASIPPFHSNRNLMDISTKFQYGLSRLNRPNCDACERLSKSVTFPILRIPKGWRNFDGGWVSKTCQATDDKTFQSRFYKFIYSDKRADKGSFVYQDNYFSNTDCKAKKFLIKVGGDFDNVSVSRNISGVYEVRLFLKWLTLTIYEDATISLVRNGGAMCGDSSKWRIGVEQNLTESNGCKLLGFAIPSSTKALIRVSKTESSQQLYLTPIMGKGTFFSSNFVSCNSIAEDFKSHVITTTTPKKHVIPEDKDFDLRKLDKHSAASHETPSSLMFFVICVLYCSRLSN